VASTPARHVPGEPLDRFLVRRLRLTWADARRAIQHSRVAVNGVVGKRYHRLLVDGDVVEIDGAPIADAPDDAVVLCHKPDGWACSHAPGDTPLIYDLVPAHLRHPDLQTAGRLDRDTTGLLILTLDGGLIQRLTDPRQALWKRYRLRLESTLPDDAVARVGGGLTLRTETEPCLPGRLAIGDDPLDATLEIREGRRWQVKRMVLALGSRIARLHRDRIGDLELPADLAPGAMRAATATELARLPQ